MTLVQPPGLLHGQVSLSNLLQHLIDDKDDKMRKEEENIQAF